MTTKIRDAIITALVMGLLLMAASGCGATPAQKLYLARQSYIGTEQAVTKLIRAGIIPPGPKLDATVAARDEAREALNAAEASIGTLGFDFVLSRLESALGRFAQFYLDHKPQPEASGEPGADAWTPSRRESPPLPQPSRLSAPPWKASSNSRVDATRRRSNRTHKTSFRSLRTPTLTTQ